MIANMTAVDTRVHTADELLRLKDDGYRYELVRGELVRMSPAGFQHGRIAKRIATHLTNFMDARRLGEAVQDTGFLIARNPDTVRAPDVAVVRAERIVETDLFFPGPPDLAVEVISPGDLYTEIDAKTREYLAAGTRAVIIVNPRNNTVRVHRPGGITEVTGILAVDDVLPGWTLPLSEIFAE